MRVVCALWRVRAVLNFQGLYGGRPAALFGERYGRFSGIDVL